MRLTVVGASGTYAGPQSPASCYLLEHTDTDGRDWRIVLDMGNGALGALQRWVDPLTIDAVVLSHLHADHCVDLETLYVLRYYYGATVLGDRLPVYGPADTMHRMAAIDGTPGAEERIGEVFAHTPLTDGETFTIGPVVIEPRRVNHPVEAYGFRIHGGDGPVLAYSGDTDTCPALIALAADADILLCEAAYEDSETKRDVHLSGARAGQAATQARVKRLVLTHIPPVANATTIAAEAQANFSGPVLLATSGLELAFPGERGS